MAPQSPNPANHLTTPLLSTSTQPTHPQTSQAASVRDDSDTEYDPTPLHSPGGPQYDELPPSYHEAQEQAQTDARNGVTPLDPNELEAHRLTLNEGPNEPEVWEYRVRGEDADASTEHEHAPVYERHPSSHFGSKSTIARGDDALADQRQSDGVPTSPRPDPFETILAQALEFTRHEPDEDIQHAPQLARPVAIPQEGLPTRRHSGPASSSQFLRAYAKALHSHSIRPAEFAEFIDGLNAIFLADPNPSSYLVQTYIGSANEVFFRPRGLAVSLHSLKSLMNMLGISTEPEQRAGTVGSILDESSNASARAQALHPWIEALDTNVPAPNAQSLVLREMAQQTVGSAYVYGPPHAHPDHTGREAAGDPPHSIPDGHHRGHHPPEFAHHSHRGRGHHGHRGRGRHGHGLPHGHGPPHEHGPPHSAGHHHEHFGRRGRGHFGHPGQGPFGRPGHGPFGPPGHGPFGLPGPGPFGFPGSGPFGRPGHGPFGHHSHSPFGPPGFGPFGHRGGRGRAGRCSGGPGRGPGPDWAEMGQNMGKWGEEFGRRMGEWGQQFGKQAEAWGQVYGRSAEAWGRDIGRRADAWGKHNAGDNDGDTNVAGQEHGSQNPDASSSEKAPAYETLNPQESGIVDSKSEETPLHDTKSAMDDDDDVSSISSDSSDSPDSDSDSSDDEDFPDTKKILLKKLKSIDEQADASAKKGKKSPEEIAQERALAIENAQNEKTAMDLKIEKKRSRRAVKREFRQKSRALKREHRQRKREMRSEFGGKGKGKAKKSSEWKEARKEYRAKRKELKKERMCAKREWKSERRGRRFERGGSGHCAQRHVMNRMVWVVIENAP